MLNRTTISTESASLGCFSPGFQRREWEIGDVICQKQLIDCYAKRRCEPVHYVDRRIHRSAFDPAQIRGGNASIDRQLFLSQKARRAKPPNIMREPYPAIHWRQSTALAWINP